MLKAEFFSLMTCLNRTSFANKLKVTNNIKKTVVFFTDKRQILFSRVLRNLLKGWENNLINYTMQNQVLDV